MNDFGPFLTNLGVSAAVAVGVLLITFAIGVAKGKHRVVDVAWGAAFAAVAVSTWVMSSGHGDDLTRTVVAGATVLWGLRLALHIAWKSWGAPEDRRYEALLAATSGNVHLAALRWVYLLQGGLVWFISLPIQVAAFESRPPMVLLWIGVAVWLVGFLFEAIGDAQLAHFKAKPKNKGHVLQTGLWRYTRHPNYFGDSMVWWGLFIMACGSWWGVATIIAPLVMTWFLAAKTGKPLMEKHMLDSRPEYADYVRRTSGFIPLPPRQ